MIQALLLVAGVLLLAGCGLFVAAEFALVTVDRASVERAAESGDRAARGTLNALRTLSTQLSGAQLGITLTNLGIGYLAQPAIARLLVGPLVGLGASPSFADGLSVLLALILATALTMVFGELVPKNIALARPLATANAAQRFQRGFTVVALPLIRFINGAANLLLRRLGIAPREELASARSAQELFSLVGRSAELGALPRETAALLQRSLLFGDRTAQDVMTPRVRMRSVDADEPVAAVIALTRRTGHSRYPVLGEDADDVVGLVHIKHAVAVPENERATTPVRAVMAPPVTVPSTLELDPLLETLRAGGLQMAIVVDEFGGVDGLVTAEDLIEEIVGDVVDEHDRVSPRAVRHRDGSWALSGLLRPEEAEELTGVPVPTDDAYQTLGGLMAAALGRIPTAGDTADIAGSRYTVERMDGRRVDRVRLERMPTEGSPGAAEPTGGGDGPRVAGPAGPGLAPGDVVLDARRPLPPAHPPRGHHHRTQPRNGGGAEHHASFRGSGFGLARLGWATWAGWGIGAQASGTGGRGLAAGGSRFGAAGRAGRSGRR
jgi:CBS domain containing-hemolysin-like protein